MANNNDDWVLYHDEDGLLEAHQIDRLDDLATISGQIQAQFNVGANERIIFMATVLGRQREKPLLYRLFVGLIGVAYLVAALFTVAYAYSSYLEETRSLLGSVGGEMIMTGAAYLWVCISGVLAAIVVREERAASFDTTVWAAVAASTVLSLNASKAAVVDKGNLELYVTIGYMLMAILSYGVTEFSRQLKRAYVDYEKGSSFTTTLFDAYNAAATS